MMNTSMMPTILRTVASRAIRNGAARATDLANRLDTINALTKEQKLVLARNARFKDKHRNQRGFVILNGPSLKEQNLDILEGEVTFVVSGFWKHPVIEKWQPTYYSLLDKNFFIDYGPTKQFFREMNARIKESFFFMPLFRGYDGNEKYNYIELERAFYIASFGDPFPSVDITELVQGFAGTAAFALAQAIYMGCNPIYLLGSDHDYLANRGIDRHFYEGGTIRGAALVDVPLGDRIPYDEEMECSLRLWRNYRSLASVAKQKGIQIFNATKGGYLDVFPRVNYDSIGNK